MTCSTLSDSDVSPRSSRSRSQSSRDMSTPSPTTLTPITLSESSLAPDVEINILDAAVYHLHSSTLRLCSEFFDASLSERWWRKENTVTDAGDIKYQYKLYDRSTYLDGISILAPVKQTGAKPDHESSVVGDGDNSLSTVKEPDAENPRSPVVAQDGDYLSLTLLIYKTLFESFYGIKTEVWSLKQAEGLIELAELYGSLPRVSGAIDRSLLFDHLGEFNVEVKCYPIRYLKVGLKLQSKVLFREAFIYAVGAARMYFEGQSWFDGDDSPSTLPVSVTQLMSMKHLALQYMEINCRGAIAQYFNGFRDVKQSDSMTQTIRRLDTTSVNNNGPSDDNSSKYGLMDAFFEIYKVVDTTAKTSQARALQNAAKHCRKIVRPFVQSTLRFTTNSTFGDIFEEFPYPLCTELKNDEYPWESDGKVVDDDDRSAKKRKIGNNTESS